MKNDWEVDLYHVLKVLEATSSKEQSLFEDAIIVRKGKIQKILSALIEKTIEREILKQKEIDVKKINDFIFTKHIQLSSEDFNRILKSIQATLLNPEIYD